jgi:hypothetical protein
MPTPSLAGALRASLRDFYFNSLRLAPANLVWGIAFVVVLLVGVNVPPAFALIPVLAIPLVGIHRLAALIARDEPADFGAFWAAIRDYGASAFAMGVGSTVLAVVLTTNVFIGLQVGGPIGWFLSAMALYGDVALAMLLVAFWPILVDPRREGLSVRQRATLAGVLVIGRPGRLLALTTVVGVILGVSAVLFAALITVSLAYVSLVSARYVLPLADQTEARLASRRTT